MVEATRQDLDKISKLIDPIHFAMMTTRGQDNLHSRPMATQKIDFDEKSLWFFTSDSSTKCSEIKKEPHVNVSFMDTKSNTYVSFVGNSEICRDKNKMKELWDSSLKSWFPKEIGRASCRERVL